MTEPSLWDVKEGDAVVVCRGLRGERVRGVATRVTPTQIVVENGDRFWKKNGREVGISGGGTWTIARSSSIEPMTHEMEAKIAERERLEKKRHAIRSASELMLRKSDAISDGDAAAIASILAKYEEE